jgi:hypothetical protein
VRLKPNQTIVRGQVRAIRPEPDGRGAEIDLEVLDNETTSPENDFLRPAHGAVLTAYLAEAARFKVGDQVRARATLMGGPNGERAVLRSVKRLRP